MELGCAVIIFVIVIGLLAACERGKWREGEIKYKERDELKAERRKRDTPSNR